MYVESGVEIVKGSIRARLVELFCRQEIEADKVIAEFQEKLGTEPDKAMTWADNIFDQVAKKSVAKQVLYCLKHFSELQEIADTLHRSMMDGARYINNKSTSVSDNFMKECRVSALVLAMETVKNYNR